MRYFPLLGLTLLHYIGHTQAGPGDPARRILAVVDIEFTKTLAEDPFGAEYLITHGSLAIEGNEKDGALRLQLLYTRFDENNPANNLYYCDVRDYSTVSDGVPGASSSDGEARRIYNIGTTDFTNKELMDTENGGAGILKKLWTDPADVFRGRYEVGVSDCMAWLTRLSQVNGPLGNKVQKNLDLEIQLQKNKEAKEQLRKGPDKWMVDARRGANVGLRYRTVVTGNPADDDAIVFRVDSSKLAQSVPGESTPVGKSYNDVQLPWDSSPQPLSEISSEETRFTGTKKGPGFEVRVLDFESSFCSTYDSDTDGFIGFKRSSNCDREKATTVDKVTMARSGGVVRMIAMVSQSALRVGGAALAAAGVAFVILDFIDHNWVGAGFGLAGIVGGIAAAALGEGPIGWIVAAVVTIFFAILPGLFGHKPTEPDKGNIAQTIQFAMFGDASHTGNEKCRKTNPNCTALYGAGVLASIFEWENFDAIAFMIAGNKGYPMSILDMAEVIKTDPTPNAVATVKCKTEHHPMPNLWNTFQNDPDEGKCKDPKFLFHRDAVTLPNINQTAAQVYDRMIPKEHGDCKLVNKAADNYTFVNYNLTVTGLPVSIACNVTPGLNINGQLMPFDKPTITTNQSNITTILSNTNNSNRNSSSQVISPGGESTSGNLGAYIAPPPPRPFQVPFNISNSVCLHGQDASIISCFPNGTYDAQNGRVGLSTIKPAFVTVPPGCHLHLIEVVARSKTPPNRQGFTNKPLTISQDTNVTTNADLKRALEQLNNPDYHHSLSVEIKSPPRPVPPPSACFFSEADFKGQAFCLGVGQGNFTAQQSGIVKSVKIFGGAITYIFSGRGLGDGSESKITADTPDLSTQYTSTNDNLAGKVNAAWITPAHNNNTSSLRRRDDNRFKIYASLSRRSKKRI